MTVSNATLSVSDGDKNHGIFNATTVTLNNVTATASGGSESYGMYHYGGTTTIRDSALSGDTASIYSHPGGNIRIANTLLDGPTNGTMTCVGAYDETFAALGTNCQ
jgi:hypothetical protein